MVNYLFIHIDIVLNFIYKGWENHKRIFWTGGENFGLYSGRPWHWMPSGIYTAI